MRRIITNLLGTSLLILAVCTALTSCEKTPSAKTGGSITIGDRSWNIGDAIASPGSDICYIDLWSEGVKNTGSGCIVEFEFQSYSPTEEQGQNIPEGSFTIGDEVYAVFTTGESFDDTGTHYYPSEGILTISGSRSGSYNIEFSGVTSSGIKLIASYKGKMDILPQ